MAARVFRGFLFPRLPLWKNRGLQASQVVLHADTCHRERFPMSGSYRFIHNSRAVLSSDLESKIQEMPIAQGIVPGFFELKHLFFKEGVQKKKQLMLN